MSIEGFRGFARRVEFDLDADFLILNGPNGAGKTSFCDAILWALTGKIERIGSANAICNYFASSDGAHVELDLKRSNGSHLRISRRMHRSSSQTRAADSNLTIELEGEVYEGEIAEEVLLSNLVPVDDARVASLDTYSPSLTRFMCLEQDRVRVFVNDDDERDRFEFVGRILGAGRLGELSSKLGTERPAWTRDTNAMVKELEPMKERQQALNSRISAFSADVDLELIDRLWSSWSKNASAIVSVAGSDSTVESRAAALDQTSVRIAGVRRRLETSRLTLVQLREQIDRLPTDVVDVESLEGSISALEISVTNANQQLSHAQETAAARQRDQLAEAEKSRELATLAQLALRNLDETCPVCDQRHDRSLTEARLRQLIAAGDMPSQAPDESAVATAAETVREVEMQLADRQRQLQASKAVQRQIAEIIGALQESATASGVIVPDDTADVDSLWHAVEDGITRRGRALDLLEADGNQLSAQLENALEMGERATLQVQLEELGEEIARTEATVQRRNEASADAKRLHDAIREHSESFVAAELRKIEPTLQRIYSTVDPHPAFRIVRFLTETKQGKGRLWTTVEAESQPSPISVTEPGQVLSSSQLNVLAVSIFLAMNLSIHNPPLETVALDDPLQSLDDINLLSLADLLRRLRGRRQVILSSHDDHLARLLERKLRPVGSDQRTLAIHLDAWSREGPIATVSEIPSDARGLRLAAA